MAPLSERCTLAFYTAAMKSSDRRDVGPLSPTAPLPTRGSSRVRVRYCECDPMGVAHHAAFIPWLEIARTELLRTGGISYRDMEHTGIFLVVTRLELRYKAPLRYDDEAVIDVAVSGGGRARLDHTYEVWADRNDGRGRSILCATGETTLACVDPTGRPRALPEWMLAAAHAAIEPRP